MGNAFPTLLVNMEPGRPNAALLQVAGGLAERLGAAVIGVASRQPMQMDFATTCCVSPELVTQANDEADTEMRGAEAEFRGAFHGAAATWRSSLSYLSPANYIVDQTRRADLLVTGMASDRASNPTRASPGELVMQCGRPVLVVPHTLVSPSLDHVMVAWKDTREARRAVSDGLPLLKLATHVTVAEITSDADMPAAWQRLDDISRWLVGHGVTAESIAAASSDDDAAQLEILAGSAAANLVVAGAYGHSRLREWAFGGVTRTLLHQGDRCAMLSH